MIYALNSQTTLLLDTIGTVQRQQNQIEIYFKLLTQLAPHTYIFALRSNPVTGLSGFVNGLWEKTSGLLVLVL